MDLSSSTQSMKRKRTLASKLADEDNVAQPVLKQQRLALEKCQKAHIEDIEDVDNDLGTCNPRPLNPESLIEASNGSDDDVPSLISKPTPRPAPKPALKPTATPMTIDSDDDNASILKSFVRKRKGEQKKSGEVARASKNGMKGGGADKTSQSETPEEELARLIVSWDSPVYGFYEPVPTIEEVEGRRCHIFECAASGCNHKVRRYLDTNDKGSTSNLTSAN